MKGIRTAVLIAVAIIMTCQPLFAADCSTTCKDGPREFKGWSRWSCNYTAGELNIRTDPDPMKSTCTLRKQGRFTNIDASYGRYDNAKECLEDFCVQALIKICGVEDRCAELKNWFK
jgi:hypothetical protein